MAWFSALWHSLEGQEGPFRSADLLPGKTQARQPQPVISASSPYLVADPEHICLVRSRTPLQSMGTSTWCLFHSPCAQAQRSQAEEPGSMSLEHLPESLILGITRKVPDGNDLMRSPSQPPRPASAAEWPGAVFQTAWLLNKKEKLLVLMLWIKSSCYTSVAVSCH